MNAKELKDKRKNANLTQQELANLIGVSLKTIQNYENGEVIPETKHEILHRVLSNPKVNEPGEVYEILPKECQEKIHFLEKELNYKDEIIDLLKEQIDLIKSSKTEK